MENLKCIKTQSLKLHFYNNNLSILDGISIYFYLSNKVPINLNLF